MPAAVPHPPQKVSSLSADHVFACIPASTSCCLYLYAPGTRYTLSLQVALCLSIFTRRESELVVVCIVPVVVCHNGQEVRSLFCGMSLFSTSVSLIFTYTLKHDYIYIYLHLPISTCLLSLIPTFLSISPSCSTIYFVGVVLSHTS